MDLNICIANINISIHSLYDIANDKIKEYIVDDNQVPDIEVFSNESLIKEEYQRMIDNGDDLASLESVEMLMIQRIIAEELPKHDAFLLHGAAIGVDRDAYVFSAKSGTGKTTHINHWLDNNKSSYVVNGDKPYILITDKEAFVCGTPWCGKENMGTNIMLPVRSIVFMERSNENRMENISFKAIFPRLLEQTYRPSDMIQMKKTLKLLLKLKELVTFYVFYFDNYKEDVYRVSYNTLTKQQ